MPEKTYVGIITVESKIKLLMDDKVCLKRDRKNKYDKNAIMCLKEGEFGGYVSASDYTTPEGCTINYDLIPYFKDVEELEGKMVTARDIVYKNGKRGYAFIAEVYLPESNTINEVTQEAKIEVLIGGTVKNYPKRIDIEKQMDGENLIVGTVSLKKKEVLIGNNPIGKIREVRYKSNVLEDCKKYIKDGSNVFIKTKEGRYLLGEIQISKEIEEKMQKEDMERVIKEIVEREIDTEENMKEKIGYFEENKIPMLLFMDILKTYTNTEYGEEDKALIKKPETLYIDKEGHMKRTLNNITKGKNVALIGDKASGKTTLAETVAWIMNRPLLTLSLSRDTDKYDIWGTKTIDYNEEGKSEVVFQDGPLTKAIKRGYMVILDEMNVADNGILVNMHSVLDHRKEVLIPDIGTPIKAHDNFLVMATQNDETYQGTNKLNPALKSRFIWLKLNPVEDIKGLLVRKKPNVKPEVLEILNTIYVGIRELVKGGEISGKSLDIRGFENVVETYDERIVDLKDVLVDCIVNQADNEDDKQHILNIVDMEI